MAGSPLYPPVRRGDASKQAHVAVPKDTYEEELGTEGFDGPASHIYHKKPPTGWSKIEGPKQPRCLYLDTFVGSDSDIEKTLMYNDEVLLSGWHLGESMTYLRRNALGDRLMFVHRGEGTLISEFGALKFVEGDYLFLPRGATYQLQLTSEDAFLYTIDGIESHIGLPERGLLGKHAHADPGVYRLPEENTEGSHGKGKEWVVRVEDADGVTELTYEFDPVDVTGWKGDLFPYALNWRDIRPIISHNYHLPPSVHATFVGEGFYVISFVPRPHESTEDAQKVPFYHRNIDYDETIFYHAGNFFSRSTVREGMITLHPRGLHHGPHPKKYREQDKLAGKMAQEVAVMVDTRRPLKVVSDLPEGAEDTDYAMSWKE